MSTLVDDLRAELARAHQNARELRAQVAAAQAERNAAVAHGEELTVAVRAAHDTRRRAEIDRDAAAAAHLRLRNAVLAWCAEMDRIRSVRATEVFAGRQEDELRMLVREAGRSAGAPRV